MEFNARNAGGKRLTLRSVCQMHSFDKRRKQGNLFLLCAIVTFTKPTSACISFFSTSVMSSSVGRPLYESLAVPMRICAGLRQDIFNGFHADHLAVLPTHVPSNFASICTCLALRKRAPLATGTNRAKDLPMIGLRHEWPTMRSGWS